MTQTKTSTKVLVLLTVVLVFAGIDQAKTHGTKGYFTINAPVEVAGTTLQPGDYSVQEVQTADGPVMEFTHIYLNPLEVTLHTHYDVVARVKVDEKASQGKTKHTQLILAATRRSASGVEIKGSSVEYSFDFALASTHANEPQHAAPATASGGRALRK
jgi:hypothetical protein